MLILDLDLVKELPSYSLFQLVHISLPQFNHKGKALAIALLEVGNVTQALHFPAHHDREAIAQGFTLIHTVE